MHQAILGLNATLGHAAEVELEGVLFKKEDILSLGNQLHVHSSTITLFQAIWKETFNPDVLVLCPAFAEQYILPTIGNPFTVEQAKRILQTKTMRVRLFFPHTSFVELLTYASLAVCL